MPQAAAVYCPSGCKAFSFSSLYTARRPSHIIAPGSVDTALFRSGKTEAQIGASAVFYSMNRVGKPEEVASVIAVLASAEASWLTGQVVRTNGGWL